MLASLPAELLRSLRLVLVIAVVTGLAYPLLVTAAAQLLFHDQANGSLATGPNGGVVGSRLLGQEFKDPRYFHGRPSATVDAGDASKALPYNAANSSGSNLSPSNQALSERVAKAVEAVRQEDGLDSGAT